MIHFQRVGDGQLSAAHGEPVVYIRGPHAHDKLPEAHVIVVEVPFALFQNELGTVFP